MMKPIVRWKWVYKNPNGTWQEIFYFYTEEEAKVRGYEHKLEYTRTEFEE